MILLVGPFLPVPAVPVAEEVLSGDWLMYDIPID